MANELEPGARRVGDLYDFNDATPEVKVALEYSDFGIGVTIPWSIDDSPYASWFLGDSAWLPTVEGQETSAPPKNVLFQDSRGSILLVGCWASGFHSNIRGPGSGTLWARAAIMDVDRDVNFSRPHGLQTEISGLRPWLGVTSWKEEIHWETRPVRTTFNSLNPERIEVGEHNGLEVSIRAMWQIQHEDDNNRRVLLDIVRCVTRGAESKAWSEHLDVHRAIRDLLTLSRWHDESCIESFVLRDDDPLITMDGQNHGEQWREVIMPNHVPTAAPKDRRQHLIAYSEIGESGLLRWLRLRDEFKRALDPVITSKRLDRAAASTLLAHTGPGLEALGYLLLLRDGWPKGKAKDAPLKLRLNRILSDLGNCLPFDGASWVESTARSYNALKHANREEPNSVDIINSWRECAMVTRAWVAIELGVPPSAVQERLSDDPQRHPYVKVK